MDILINGNAVDALSCIVHVDKAVQSGRTLCAKLKDVIPRYSTATHKCVFMIFHFNSNREQRGFSNQAATTTF